MTRSGRPPLPPGERRGEETSIKVRLSAAEREMLERAALSEGEARLGTWLRERALGVARRVLGRDKPGRRGKA